MGEEMKTQISKLARLARITWHLAADGEAQHPEMGRDEWTRGKAIGYLRAARILKESESEN